MDFNDTPEQAKFRAKCREWLEANAALKESKSGGQSDSSLDDHLKIAKAWQQKKYEAGWAMLHCQKNMGVLKLHRSKESYGDKRKQNLMCLAVYLKLVLVCAVQ